jgi:hypothetical protein
MKFRDREDLSRKGAKAQRRKENPLETRQRFAPLRLCVKKSSRKNTFGVQDLLGA